MTTKTKTLDLAGKLVFEPQAGRARDALVMVFDLEGFSTFYGQPDVHDYVAKYLNHVFGAVGTTIDGGPSYWSPREEMLSPFLVPAYVKFLGDGALYLWTFNKGEREAAAGATLHFVNRLWNLRKCFGKVLERCADDVPVADMPRGIRVGFAAGSVHQINYKYTSRVEYVGHCINLASRLQSYCRDLGFIASARVGFSRDDIEKHGYMKVIATRIKGFPREVVIVDRGEFLALPDSVRTELFEV